MCHLVLYFIYGFSPHNSDAVSSQPKYARFPLEVTPLRECPIPCPSYPISPFVLASSLRCLLSCPRGWMLRPQQPFPVRFCLSSSVIVMSLLSKIACCGLFVQSYKEIHAPLKMKALILQTSLFRRIKAKVGVRQARVSGNLNSSKFPSFRQP